MVSGFLATISQDKIPLIVVLGPTASGKTGLGIDLALKFNGEIISADSRQIYREMDIGTAKVTKEEMKGVLHYMIDIVDPSEKFNTFDYKRMAEQKIEEIWKHGKVPFLVGGTGLYIRSITDNFDLGQTPPDLELREKLEKEAEEFGKEYVWNKLNALDPVAAAKIHFNNLRYVVRGIEKVVSSQWSVISNKEIQVPSTKYQVLKIGIEWSREVLYDRINKRVDIQVEQGLVEETQRLFAKYDGNLTSMTSIGYPQIAKFIYSELTLDEAKDLLKKDTRHYAKRQMTWFSKEEVNWIDGASFSH